jgi:L-lactate dehydrogenase complex protein LldF
VRINLHELLLDNRHEAVKQGISSLMERISWKVWKTASLNRSMMNMSNGSIKNKVVNTIFKGWTKHHSDLDFSKKTFNEMWKDRK